MGDKCHQNFRDSGRSQGTCQKGPRFSLFSFCFCDSRRLERLSRSDLTWNYNMGSKILMSSPTVWRRTSSLSPLFLPKMFKFPDVLLPILFLYVSSSRYGGCCVCMFYLHERRRHLFTNHTDKIYIFGILLSLFTIIFVTLNTLCSKWNNGLEYLPGKSRKWM